MGAGGGAFGDQRHQQLPTAVVPQISRIVVGADPVDRERLRASVREAARRPVARP